MLTSDREAQKVTLLALRTTAMTYDFEEASYVLAPQGDPAGHDAEYHDFYVSSKTQ